MNRGEKLRTLRLQFSDHLFNAKPHEKTHLVREPCHVESLRLTNRSQTRKIYMGSHILLADTNEWIVVRLLLEIAKERAVLPIRPIEILRRMAVIDRQNKSTIHPPSDLLYPVHRL